MVRLSVGYRGVGWICFCVTAIFFCSVLPVLAQTQTVSEEEEPAWNIRHDVYLTPDEALKAVFPDATEIQTENIRLTPEARERVARAVGHPLLEESFVVYKGYRNDKLLGYAIIGEEIGKFRPITSIVAIGPDGKVKDVRVMVYRESHGDDVKRKRFLHQYDRKGKEDPIRIHRDIIAISGATISVRAMNAQVRKVVHVIHEAYFAQDTGTRHGR